ncbi:MAG TPA: hypothetical protein VFF98_17295 [Novosphingobium sp.]|nr:hypothetical protein [Novosphingobium sp.]HZV08602.1 hypothetical protein [Novosphingobium sp.]
MTDVAISTDAPDYKHRVIKGFPRLAPFVAQMPNGPVRFKDAPDLFISVFTAEGEEPCIGIMLYEPDCPDCPVGHGAIYLLPLEHVQTVIDALNRSVAEVAARAAKGAH